MLLQQDTKIHIPSENTGNLSEESLLTMVTSINKTFPNSRILLYTGKGTLYFEYDIDGYGDVTGNIYDVGVKGSEVTNNLTGTQRNSFLLNENGDNLRCKNLTLISDIEDHQALCVRHQEDLVSTWKFDATLNQEDAFLLELETMEVVTKVQAEFPLGKVILCNEIVDRKAGNTAKSTTNEDCPGVVFVTAYIVPASQLGTNIFFNNDRNQDFLKKLEAQIPDVSFDTISRERSDKQKARCDDLHVKTATRNAERRAEARRAGEELVAQLNAQQRK